jgi:serine/threonine protein kinase
MPSDKDVLFGEFAVKRGYLIQTELDEAVRNQRAMREQMGVRLPLVQVLVSKDLLTKDQAQEVMREVDIHTGDVYIVADYEIVAQIGEGGFGIVFKARDRGTNELVALKILPPSIADEEHISRFRREAEIVRQLHHDNINGYVAFGYDERRKCYYCALEFVEGVDLETRIERSGRLSEDEAISITRQIAMALQHAHHNGLVHRDVKPANIMVKPDGTAKLCDLGLACPTDTAATRITRSSVAGLGTPAYMSPEHVNSRDVDVRSDIYSLGATLYHMVTGRPPFEGSTAVEIVSKHLRESAPWPADINPAVSKALCVIIMKMMAKEPADRYQTPSDLHLDLDLLEAGQEPEIGDRVRATSTIALPAGLAHTPPHPPAETGPPSVSRAEARPRCHVCGMSLDPEAVAEGGHVCPSCDAKVPAVPRIWTSQEDGGTVVVARGRCSYDGFVVGLGPVMEAIARKAPAKVVLDISELSPVSAELASLIIPWVDNVREWDGVLEVLCSGEALRVFELVGLSRLVEIRKAKGSRPGPGKARQEVAMAGEDHPPAPGRPAPQEGKQKKTPRWRASMTGRHAPVMRAGLVVLAVVVVALSFLAAASLLGGPHVEEDPIVAPRLPPPDYPIAEPSPMNRGATVAPEPSPHLRPHGDPVRERLDEINSWFEPSLRRHREIRVALQVIIDVAHRRPREATEARVALDKLERDLAKLADDAAQKADAKATELADRGEYRAAIAELEAVSDRFEGSEWYREGGAGWIKGRIKMIESRREDSEFTALESARELVDTGKLVEAREVLAARANWSSDRASELAEELLKEIDGRDER